MSQTFHQIVPPTGVAVRCPKPPLSRRAPPLHLYPVLAHEVRVVQSNAVDISDTERDLARQVARRFRTQNPDDFESELVLRIPAIRASAPPETRNWLGFLNRALRHDAIDILRAWKRNRVLAAQETPPDVTDSATDTLDLVVLEDSLKRAVTSIPERLSEFWMTLAEENGRIGRTALRSGIHRNTARAWISQIKAVLNGQRFCTTPEHCAKDAEPSPLETNEHPVTAMKTRPEPLDPYTKIPNALLDWLMRQSFNGTQFRIVIWIMRNTFGWHRGTVRFSWCRIARELRMDRGNTSRTGKELVSLGAVEVADKRIAIVYQSTVARTNLMPDGITISPMAPDAEPHQAGCESASFLRRAKERFKEMTSKEKRSIRKKKSEPQGGAAGAATPQPGKYRDVDAGL